LFGHSDFVIPSSLDICHSSFLEGSFMNKDPERKMDIVRGDITKLDVDAIVMPPTRHFSAVAVLMARFIARLGPNCLQNAGR
jgi:hypothetical protein